MVKLKAFHKGMYSDRTRGDGFNLTALRRKLFPVRVVRHLRHDKGNDFNDPVLKANSN